MFSLTASSKHNPHNRHSHPLVQCTSEQKFRENNGGPLEGDDRPCCDRLGTDLGDGGIDEVGDCRECLFKVCKERWLEANEGGLREELSFSLCRDQTG